MIGIGVIGYGYWGPNLVRNFIEAPGAQIVAVSDLREERLAAVKARYPAIKTTRNYNDLLTDSSIDAIVVATPISTHFELAMQSLQAGKHALVEKPLTATVDEGLRLLEEAEKYNRILMVDHTFIYTGAVRKIKEIISQGLLGPIYYYDSVRVNLGLIQHDVNVLWDLAVHDLSIMDFVLGQQPCAVSATGQSHVGKMEDIAYMSCIFDDGLIAHIHANWLAPVKVRRTLIGGGNQMIVYDDLEPSEKVKIYDKGVTLNGNGGSEKAYQRMVEYRSGDMWAPKLNTTEALYLEVLHFIDCITSNRHPITDGEAGLRTVHLLESANRSLKQNGQPVELTWERVAV